jgi:hypothetical protein
MRKSPPCAGLAVAVIFFEAANCGSSPQRVGFPRRRLLDVQRLGDQELGTLIPELDSVLRIIANGLSESFGFPLL